MHKDRPTEITKEIMTYLQKDRTNERTNEKNNARNNERNKNITTDMQK